ncbi:MAG: hypothetical protein ACK5YO_01175, partial [Planctomyces sp.]
MLAGRPVELLPNSIDIVTGVLSAHGLVAGDRFRLSNSPDGAYDTEFTVSSATANTFTFSAFNFKKSPPAGSTTNRGQIFHDGSNTAYIRT